MVRPERFELPTYWFEASCSIQLSYRRGYNKTYCIPICRAANYFVEGAAAGCASGGGGTLNSVTRSTMSRPARRSNW